MFSKAIKIDVVTPQFVLLLLTKVTLLLRCVNIMFTDFRCWHMILSDTPAFKPSTSKYLHDEPSDPAAERDRTSQDLLSQVDLREPLLVCAVHPSCQKLDRCGTEKAVSGVAENSKMLINVGPGDVTISVIRYSLSLAPSRLGSLASMSISDPRYAGTRQMKQVITEKACCARSVAEGRADDMIS